MTCFGLILISYFFDVPYNVSVSINISLVGSIIEYEK